MRMRRWNSPQFADRRETDKHLSLQGSIRQSIGF
jgi:hypothetical protein